VHLLNQACMGKPGGVAWQRITSLSIPNGCQIEPAAFSQR